MKKKHSLVAQVVRALMTNPEKTNFRISLDFRPSQRKLVEALLAHFRDYEGHELINIIKKGKL